MSIQIRYSDPTTETTMTWLKNLFIQRFSFMDVVVVGTAYASELSLVGLIIVVAVWSAFAVFTERMFYIRSANGHTRWEDI